MDFFFQISKERLLRDNNKKKNVVDVTYTIWFHVYLLRLCNMSV